MPSSILAGVAQGLVWHHKLIKNSYVINLTFDCLFGSKWNNTAKIFNTSGEVVNINMTIVAPGRMLHDQMLHGQMLRGQMLYRLILQYCLDKWHSADYIQSNLKT